MDPAKMANGMVGVAVQLSLEGGSFLILVVEPSVLITNKCLELMKVSFPKEA